MRVNPEQLITFSVVAEYGSVSKAAEVLHLSQPAVSGQLRNLQEQVGQPLYQRRARGIELTNAGEELLPYAHAIARNVRQVSEHIVQWQQRSKRHVELGLSNALGTHSIDLIHKANGADIQVNVTSGIAADLVQQVQRGDLDAAVVIAPVSSSELDQHVIGGDELRLIVPKDHALSSAGYVSLTELSEQTLLWAAAGSGVKRQAERVMAHAGVAPKESLDLGSLDAVRAALLAGYGVAMLPASYVRHEVEVGLLHSLGLEAPKIGISHLLVTPPAKVLRSEVRALVDLLMPLRQPDAK